MTGSTVGSGVRRLSGWAVVAMGASVLGGGCAPTDLTPTQQAARALREYDPPIPLPVDVPDQLVELGTTMADDVRLVDLAYSDRTVTLCYATRDRCTARLDGTVIRTIDGAAITVMSAGTEAGDGSASAVDEAFWNSVEFRTETPEWLTDLDE